MYSMALKVVNLTVNVDGKRVLSNINLEAEPGKLLVIMGPNGSGKTSLALTIMGHPSYKIVEGKILLDGEDITNLPPNKRAEKGLFLIFQNPVEISGVNIISLLRAVLRKRLGIPNIRQKIDDLEKKVEAEAEILGMKKELLHRDLNVGFSGGERKRGELLQAKILRPRYIIMDEPDSGLDVDGVRTVADIIKEFLTTNTSVILITHYPRILEYIKPDKVIVLYNGKIVAEGREEIIEKINREGYNWIIKAKSTK